MCRLSDAFRPNEMSRGDTVPSTHIGRTLLSVDESSTSLPYPTDQMTRNISAAASTEHKQLTTGCVKTQCMWDRSCIWDVRVLLILWCIHPWLWGGSKYRRHGEKLLTHSFTEYMAGLCRCQPERHCESDFIFRVCGIDFWLSVWFSHKKTQNQFCLFF